MTVLDTTGELAASLNRPLGSIYDARHRGSGPPPAITNGARLYFAQEDIDEWVEQKRRDARTEMGGRRQAIPRGADRTRPNSGRPQNSGEPWPALSGDHGSLSRTASSKGVSYE